VQKLYGRRFVSGTVNGPKLTSRTVTFGRRPVSISYITTSGLYVGLNACALSFQSESAVSLLCGADSVISHEFHKLTFFRQTYHLPNVRLEDDTAII
jgi:hypothetical protein